MKSVIKTVSYMALAGFLCLGLGFSAQAQHHDGGGGGGSRPAASSPAPSRSSSSFSPRSSSNSAPQRYNNSRQQNSSATRGAGITQQRSYAGHTVVGVNGAQRVQPGVAVQTNRSYNTSGSYYGHNHTGGFSGGVSVRAGFTAHGSSYYHYNHGYYGSYYAPRLGFSIGILPYGYYPFYYGDYQYFYSGGLFYQYDNDQYTVVEPPVGAEVKTLPSDAQSIVINGQQYYEADGVYYVPITKDDGTLSYQVAGKDGELNTADQSVDNAPAAPQIGDVVDQLPPNCKKISINGQRLYLSQDGIYYKAVVDANGNTTFQIVGLPADNDQDQPDQTSN